MEYLLECKVRRLSQGTIDNYDRHLRYLRQYLEDEYGIMRLEDVKPAHLKRFLLEKEDLGRKPQYINDLLKVFKTFFRYCVEEEYLKTSPAAKVKNVRQPKVLIRTFNEEEVLKMLNFHSGHDFISMRNKAMLALFFDTGMRLTEVMTMKDEQIRDRFGMDVKLTSVSDEVCSFTVPVTLSPEFFGWVLSFGGRMKLISPSKAKILFRSTCYRIDPPKFNRSYYLESYED